MYERRCLDFICPKNNESVPCLRRHFFYHAQTKSNEKLITIFKKHDLVRTPEFLSRLTLLNLFVDFSTEPMASAIIEGSIDDMW